MMKKKSTLFALIAVACIAIALFFMYKETRETYDLGDFDEEPEQEEREEPEPEPVKKTDLKQSKNADNDSETETTTQK